jgi:iron-sulfur cluster repair protein YtfE (RIC family)
MMANTNPPDLAQDLLRIHRALTRGLNVGVERGAEFAQHGFPDAGLRQGFAAYIQGLSSVLEAHHLAEDEIAFPFFKERLPSSLYDRLAAHHQKITALLAPVRKATLSVAAGDDPAELAGLVDGLRSIKTIWAPHIGLEEEHFSSEALAAVMTREEQARMSGMMAKHSQEHATPGYLALPFTLFNLQPDDRAAMAAAMPSIVMDELIPKAWKDQWAPMKPFLLD